MCCQNGYTPLHIAAKMNRVDIAKVLLRYGADPGAQSKVSSSLLLYIRRSIYGNHCRHVRFCQSVTHSNCLFVVLLVYVKKRATNYNNM